MNTDRIIDEAIALVAKDWPKFDEAVPFNLHFRDKVTFFGQRVRPALLARFPDLIAATDQVMLLILAKGIAQSGCVPKRHIERDLGILLPP